MILIYYKIQKEYMHQEKDLQIKCKLLGEGAETNNKTLGLLDSQGV